MRQYIDKKGVKRVVGLKAITQSASYPRGFGHAMAPFLGLETCIIVVFRDPFELVSEAPATAGLWHGEGAAMDA